MLASETQCQCSAQPNDETASNQFPIHDGFHNTNMNSYSYMATECKPKMRLRSTPPAH